MFKSLTFISASLFILCLTVHSEAQMTVEELNAAVEQALLDAGAGQAPPATSTADVVRIPIVNQSPLTDEVELTSEVEVQINPTQVNFAPIPADYFDYAKYNELRNVRDYDSDRYKEFDINGTSNRILLNISENPARFTGYEGLSFFPGRSEIAPLGSADYDDRGRRVFQVTNSRSDRRENAIIGVYYENIREVSAQNYPQSAAIQDVYEADLLLLSHLNGVGAFFTKVRIELDWSDFAGVDKGVVKVLSQPQTIPLIETDFEVYVDLGKQKTILKDNSEHNLRIVFAITSGGFDNRSSVDGVVGSMSLQMPRNLVPQNQLDSNPELEYQDFDKETSFLVKRTRWSNTRVNTDIRTAPYFFNGRPFISIIDTRFVERDENGQLPQNLHGGYRLVGFHDKIESEGLIRAAYSNGCLRTPDPDLYALDVIVNYGPKDLVPVSAKMSQPEFSDYEAIIPRQNLYRQSILQVRDDSLNDARTVDCGPSTSDYTVKYYNGIDGRRYQTMVSSSCLTGMATVNQNPESMVNYIIDKNQNGRAGVQAPASSIASIDAFHTSIQRRREKLLSTENYNRIPLFRAQLRSIHEIDAFISDYSLETQRDKIALIDELENEDSPSLLLASGSTHPNRVPILNLYNTYPAITHIHGYWRDNLTLINTTRTQDDRNIFANINGYQRACAGKRVNFPTSANGNCRAVFDAINRGAHRINATLSGAGGLF